ncbi:MAG: hypothetical protein ABFD97_19010 [Syntrophobacter sp.]
MTRIILLVLGATFIYTGLLVFDRDPAAAISTAALGIVLLFKPAMEAVLYLRTHLNRGQRIGTVNKPGESRRRGQLRMVKPRENNQEDKPTIH